MSVYSELIGSGLLRSTVTRPAGADSFGPRPGVRVPWVVCRPVGDLLVQGKRLGWANLGTIGNEAHLRLHGDHTPWSLGKLSGVLYAKDTNAPEWFGAAFRTLCREDDYDTSAIDFWNWRGRQYDYAGKDIRASGDYHLHVSFCRGAELRTVHYFDDAVAVHNGVFGQIPIPPEFGKLGFISGARLIKQPGNPAIWLSGRGKRTHVLTMPALNAVMAYMSTRQMSADILDVTVLPGAEV